MKQSITPRRVTPCKLVFVGGFQSLPRQWTRKLGMSRTIVVSQYKYSYFKEIVQLRKLIHVCTHDRWHATLRRKGRYPAVRFRQLKGDTKQKLNNKKRTIYLYL